MYVSTHMKSIYMMTGKHFASVEIPTSPSTWISHSSLEDSTEHSRESQSATQSKRCRCLCLIELICRALTFNKDALKLIQLCLREPITPCMLFGHKRPAVSNIFLTLVDRYESDGSRFIIRQYIEVTEVYRV